MNGNLVRKVSPKTVIGKVKAPDQAKALYTVIGIATGTKSGTSDYGVWTSLSGRFEATNLETGEIFVGPNCFLPEPLNSMIAETLNETDAEGKSVNHSVQFGVEVGIKPSEVPIGYEYTVRELVDKTEADPLAALRREIKLALAAPVEKPAAVKKK